MDEPNALMTLALFVHMWEKTTLIANVVHVLFGKMASIREEGTACMENARHVKNVYDQV